MLTIDRSLPSLAQLVEQRVTVLKNLIGSLEASTLALSRNDADAIASGAAQQADLCRQWSDLERHLRLRKQQCDRLPNVASQDAHAVNEIAGLESEWVALQSRIRYLARVHWSLLRHLERSLSVMSRIALSCAPAYTFDPRVVADGPRVTRECRGS